MTLTEKEVTEAVREWCERRFPLKDGVKVGWQAYRNGDNGFRLEFSIDGVEMPPKEGPYR